VLVFVFPFLITNCDVVHRDDDGDHQYKNILIVRLLLIIEYLFNKVCNQLYAGGVS
jgi:hypothetical protein